MNYHALNLDETSWLLAAMKKTLQDRRGLSEPQIQFYEQSITRLKEKLKAMRRGDDPRNEQDYDTFDYGTEPLPGDTIWVKTGYCE